MRLAVFRFAVIVCAACMLSGLTLTGGAQTPAPVPAQVVIPPNLQYVAEFVSILQGAGLVVQSVQRSHLEGTFLDTQHAAFITTNLGVVEVAIFNGEMDAEDITITYSKDKPLGSTVPHLYVIQGVPFANGSPTATMHAASPFYFTLYHRWFIQTMDAPLDVILKHAFGQSNHPVSPRAEGAPNVSPSTKAGGADGADTPKSEGVTSPVPLDAPKPSYTASAKNALIEGTVRIRCIVQPTGICTNIEVVQSLDKKFGLDEEAVNSVKLWRFKPGMKFGQPVPVLVTLDVKFALR